MLLYRNDIGLPVERKPLLCVLGVPNHMTYADFLPVLRFFCASYFGNAD
ncbi:hypothetical protein G4B88_011068 [Cannabis sativa]|uniref:BRCA1-associated 2/ETP1 RRM domain-containing protein n=1 Tax=Cannabis sativa TaxID=3483 RepID=A0A7J6FAM6_CANSA|nr:hypothetical protein G4B88_011068 [Cannabis sativa]